MSSRLGRALVAAGLSAAMLAGVATEAFAGGNRPQSAWRAGHGYHRYGYYRRGNPALGAAVAGTALGVIGLAAGAAAARRYDDGGYYDGYGAYGPGPGYYGAGPGYYGYGQYGYAPY